MQYSQRGTKFSILCKLELFKIAINYKFQLYIVDKSLNNEQFHHVWKYIKSEEAMANMANRMYMEAI